MSKTAQQQALRLIARGVYTDTRTKEQVVPMKLVEQAFTELQASTAIEQQQHGGQDHMSRSMKDMSDGLNKRY